MKQKVRRVYRYIRQYGRSRRGMTVQNALLKFAAGYGSAALAEKMIGRNLVSAGIGVGGGYIAGKWIGVAGAVTHSLLGNGAPVQTGGFLSTVTGKIIGELKG